MNKLEDKIYGCLVGGLIGDAMGAPGEGKTYREIQEQMGPITDFEGQGTDDTAIREQLIRAIFATGGYPTVDAFAQTFIDCKQTNYHLWYIPVKNAFHKLEAGLSLPAYAGWGNQQSSSTAMAFSPMGIINACHPRQAALEALQLGSFIHNGPSGFCRDGAAALSAAVAEAFSSGATAKSIAAASTRYLLPISAGEMIGLIEQALALARKAGSYEKFRSAYYESSLREIISDSRETVPVVMAIVDLAEGDPRRALLWGANFGRDADTISTMIGGIVGALHGAAGLPREWVAKVEANPNVQYREMTPGLAEIVRRRVADAGRMAATIEGMV